MTGFRTPGPLGTMGSELGLGVLAGGAAGAVGGASAARGAIAALGAGAALGVGAGLAAAAPGPVAAAPSAATTAKTKSGKSWVAWANTNATKSDDVEELSDPFRANVKAFIKALKDGGATVTINTTTRSKKRAYLFHWSWKIYLGKCKPGDAKAMAGVPIEWDHGDLKASKAGAGEMVKGFGLAVPPRSKVAPSLSSNHIRGEAIDMDIVWTGKIKVKKKDGTEVELTFMDNANKNTALHQVGASYSVKKHTGDEPHWSVTGR